MTTKVNLRRDEVDASLCWDLKDLFADETTARKELDALKDETARFVKKYEGKIATADQWAEALEAYKALRGRFVRVGTYAFLNASTDSTDANAVSLQQDASMVQAGAESALAFFEAGLYEADANTLEAVRALGDCDAYLDEIERRKPHRLSDETERTLAALTPVLDAPYTLYNRAKLADLRFPSFTVEGTEHPLSFGLFEGHYEHDTDHRLRREAFDRFHEGLNRVRHTIAGTLNAQMQSDKIQANLRGFDSVIDALVFEQNVDRSLYDRQVDAIQNQLPPLFRRYAEALRKQRGLNEMTFADLLTPFAPEWEGEVSLSEAKESLLEALAPLGESYADVLRRAFEEQWVDFAENEGKATGAFCASPYGAHPYILISWTARTRELFVLAHELGHAGHFTLTQKNHHILHARPSMYLVEAPSTMNELFMADWMRSRTDDPNRLRWIASMMISRTYYHNFVTHGLEAVFQRECYRRIDAGESLSADAFDAIFRETLENFWGDAVRIQPGAEKTWMRQPHYYRGLYPYTYSAGLTLGTAANRRIVDGEPGAVEDWLAFLKAGSTKDPIGLAKLAGVDLTTDRPLQQTLETIESLVETLER